MLLAEADIETLTGRIGLTVIAMAFEVAGLPLTHVRLDVITTVITSPLAGAYEYVVLFVPTSVDPTYHWYNGVPPLTGVAVNVTEVPAHTGLLPATIETLAESTGLTTIVMVFEVAGLPLTHVRLDVITTVIISPLAGVYEYVAKPVPTGVDPLYHWYEGVVPSLVGVAVNVTEVPAQTGLAVAPIETLTGSKGLTVIVPVDVHISLVPSDKVTEYDPEAVGVPWIVTIGAVKEEVRPAGNVMLETCVAPVAE
jgi:hypothetical protein